MAPKQSRVLILFALCLFFPGCFETQFSFDTTVERDGTVLRESRIDGRGAYLFGVPEGPGWESKTWETKGDETFLPNTYNHILSKGKFSAGQMVPSDFRLNIESFLDNVGEDGRKRMEALGIKPPYENKLFAANEIRIYRVPGWFTVTTIYEETFRTGGIIPLLLRDLEAEIKKTYRPADHPADQPADFSQMAFERLEKEILPRFEFRVKVSLPGKITSTNALHSRDNTAAWLFTLRDFEGDYSSHVLKASSRFFRLPGLVLLAVLFLIAALMLLLVIVGISRVKKTRRGRRRPEKA
jgi:hypothetical protein